MSRIVFRYSYMQQLVDFALKTLRDNSPVGSLGDAHPGLYRDSHLVFLDGHIVDNVAAWRPGQQINIANPVPYSRKIELAQMQLSVPGHVYELAAPVIAARYGNSAEIKFVFMPVRFGDVGAYAAFSRRIRPGRRLSDKARADWLARQPALQITGR